MVELICMADVFDLFSGVTLINFFFLFWISLSVRTNFCALRLISRPMNIFVLHASQRTYWLHLHVFIRCSFLCFFLKLFYVFPQISLSFYPSLFLFFLFPAETLVGSVSYINGKLVSCLRKKKTLFSIYITERLKKGVLFYYLTISIYIIALLNTINVMKVSYLNKFLWWETLEVY